MRTHILLPLLLATALTARPAEPVPPPGPFLRVATVQLRSEPDIRANVAKIKQHLTDCAARQVQIVAFPECAVSGYFGTYISTLTDAEIAAAAREIAAACRENKIAAIVGTPERRDGKMFNTALIINASGEIIARYDKAQPVGQDRAWQCLPGSAPSPVFTVGSARASVIICHDNRFPELARLPVLAGSRVIFYISSEAVLAKEQKMGPYRAQAQAIAVENRVYLVHANPPANDVNSGSHGQSRVIDTDGNIIQEAGIFKEEVLVADLDLSKATAEFALEALNGPLGDWWREGLKRVPVLP